MGVAATLPELSEWTLIIASGNTVFIKKLGDTLFLLRHSSYCEKTIVFCF